MNVLLQMCLLLSGADPTPQREVTYQFATSDYIIEMRVKFLAPFRGQRLAFYSNVEPEKEICYSGDPEAPDKCLQRFLGAGALVTYRVSRWDGDPPGPALIREHVTVLTQSPGLTARAPFSKTQSLARGMASDIQVFGFDEAPIKKADLARTREEMRRTLWRLYKQELYIDQELQPFAIVEWKHALDRISIVRIYAPPPDGE